MSTALINRNSNPLVPPTDLTGYHPDYDRSGSGMGPPDGTISALVDVFGVARQFGQHCN